MPVMQILPWNSMPFFRSSDYQRGKKTWTRGNPNLLQLCKGFQWHVGLRLGCSRWLLVLRATQLREMCWARVLRPLSMSHPEFIAFYLFRYPGSEERSLPHYVGPHGAALATLNDGWEFTLYAFSSRSCLSGALSRESHQMWSVSTHYYHYHR